MAKMADELRTKRMLRARVANDEQARRADIDDVKAL